MSDSVKIRYQGSLARILLNRPKRRNALDRPTGEALLAAVEGVARRDDLAVVVLEGAGDHFCSGWDLSEFARLSQADDEEVASYLVANVHLLRRLANLPWPSRPTWRWLIPVHGSTFPRRSSVWCQRWCFRPWWIPWGSEPPSGRP